MRRTTFLTAILAAAPFLVTGAAAQQKRPAPIPIPTPKTSYEAKSLIRDAADKGRLPEAVAQWKKAYDATRQPLMAYAYEQAAVQQYDLHMNLMAPKPAGWDPKALYTVLEKAAAKESKAYPVVAMYYLVGQHPNQILGFRSDKPVSTSPGTVRDPKTGEVRTIVVENFEEDKRLTARLAKLYAEMVRRQPEDPYVVYVGAMRTESPSKKVELLKKAYAAGGSEMFKAPLLVSLRQAYLEAGDKSNARNAEADLRAYISSRGSATTAKLFKKLHPEIWR